MDDTDWWTPDWGMDRETAIACMKEGAKASFPNRVSLIAHVDRERYAVFTRAMSNVLSTDISLETYAQIIDGLPIADVAWDRRTTGLFGDHPLDEHEQLCPGAVDKALELRDNWDPAVLRFNPKLVDAYRGAPLGSKAFETRLLELVAVALHELIVIVFNLNLRLHRGDIDSITNWTMPDQPDMQLLQVPPRPTLFSHPFFMDLDIYPQGLADVVGYWAEDRIISGVVIFDRRSERAAVASGQPLPNVWPHANRAKVTYRPFQLRDDQQKRLLDFLVAETPPPPGKCPLPVLGDKQNTVRVDFLTAITRHGIFRDIWERKPPTKDEFRYWAQRPKSEMDYPEARALMQLASSMPLSRELAGTRSESGNSVDSFFNEYMANINGG